jgi:hypothetical protein
MKALSLIVTLVVAGLLAPESRAALITYRDDNGTTHVVQSEDEIPEQYRSRKKKISGKKEFEPGRAPLTKSGNNFFVEADFGAAGVHKMQIDMKVVFTTISPAIQAALKLQKIDRATIETTSGNIAHFPMVNVPKITVAGMPVENLKVVAAADGEDGASGRLGQSFFNRFTVKIDSEREELYLTPKKK